MRLADLIAAGSGRPAAREFDTMIGCSVMLPLPDEVPVTLGFRSLAPP